ncbi:MAG: hypothetical protein E2601_06455 [Microbacterium sp.]|nr:hypothetical protein [Microbacterium sp.]
MKISFAQRLRATTGIVATVTTLLLLTIATPASADTIPLPPHTDPPVSDPRGDSDLASPIPTPLPDNETTEEEAPSSSPLEQTPPSSPSEQSVPPALPSVSDSSPLNAVSPRITEATTIVPFSIPEPEQNNAVISV